MAGVASSRDFAAPAAGGRPLQRETSLGLQLRLLAKRSVVRTFRQPFITIPTLVFPLFFLAINAAGLSAATAIEGFPTDNYVTFALATAFVQAGMSTVMVAGGGLAEDIHSGFLSRLSMTPMRAAVLVASHLVGTAVMALVGAVVYIAVALAAGAEIETGIAGGLVLLPLSMLIALAFGSIGVLAALKTGSAEAVQGVFPLLFVLLFMSSMSLPRDLIEIDWFQTVATYNPMSYFIEAPRSLLISGWDAEALALGSGMALAVCVICLAVSGRLLRRRVPKR